MGLPCLFAFDRLTLGAPRARGPVDCWSTTSSSCAITPRVDYSGRQRRAEYSRRRLPIVSSRRGARFPARRFHERSPSVTSLLNLQAHPCTLGETKGGGPG